MPGETGDVRVPQARRDQGHDTASDQLFLVPANQAGQWLADRDDTVPIVGGHHRIGGVPDGVQVPVGNVGLDRDVGGEPVVLGSWPGVGWCAGVSADAQAQDRQDATRVAEQIRLGLLQGATLENRASKYAVLVFDPQPANHVLHFVLSLLILGLWLLVWLLVALGTGSKHRHMLTVQPDGHVVWQRLPG